ncbi:DsbE family thiol:disulfide interchange protein [Actibacterium ureilyticum]|uniref:DsbE family thiol:disulfide interchange protein n=1 Tax=Actibacterium ureilyticum TaxID=1590614 RepID=UPI000BAAB08D|nr:DsbE family thiol:disulfide interchange protein [Actibacterium ureilyticum]
MADQKISPLMILPPLLFAGLAALFFLGMSRDDPDALPSTLVGRPAPALELLPFEGMPPLGDADLKTGEVVLVNFWASWCAPCRVEHPQLLALKADGVRIHGINYKDTRAKAQVFLDDLGNPYDLAGTDPEGRMAIEWGVYGVPETFVISGDGTVVLRHAGPITASLLQSVIKPAIAEAAGG